MKKILSIILAMLMIFSLAACVNTGTPNSNDDFEEAQNGFNDIESSSNKSDIEKTIKNVFGVDISLPNAESYSADKLELSGVSTYIVLITGSSQNAEQYYNSVKSKFSKWTALDGSKSFSYETEKVTYGAVFTDEDGTLSIAFTMTDKELLGDLISTPKGFCDAIKKVSGISITLPSSITSIGMADLRNDGALASYSGMLLADGASLNKAQFDEMVASLDSQLSGFTKTVEGGDTDMSVIWTNNSDSSQYFEAEYYEFDGTPMASLAFNYTDKSLLAAWPASQIDQVIGVATGIPAYDGEYTDLEVNYDEEYPDEISIELSNISETELNDWLEALTNAGFNKIGTDSEYSETYWSKQINDTTYVEVDGWYSEYGDTGEISIWKEVLDNASWPTSAISEALGQTAAAKLPTVASAPRRTFETDDSGSYGFYIYVMDVADQALMDSYCQSLLSAGFVKTSERYHEYAYQWDNYDKLEVSVSYEGMDDGGNTYMYVRAKFIPYEPVIVVPTNVKIVYDLAEKDYSGNIETSAITIIKIGEDWYIETSSRTYFFKYNSTEKTWTAHYLAQNWSTKEYYWTEYKGGEDDNIFDRYEIDELIGSALSYLYMENIVDGEYEASAGSLTVVGKSCTKYEIGYSTKTTYWYNEDTRLILKREGDSWYNFEVSIFDTTVTSFGDIELPQ